MPNSHNDPACIICRKQCGEFPVPGGAVYQDDLVYASHAHLTEGQTHTYLGWMVVETRRHTPGLAEVSDEEAQRLGLLVARISHVLKNILGAEHVYSFVLGHHVPHLHIHVLPRYPGTPREYWGVRLDEWPEAPRGDAEAIANLSARIRKSLQEKEKKK